MKKLSIIKWAVAGILLAGAVTCFTLGGIKTGECSEYASIVNETDTAITSYKYANPDWETVPDKLKIVRAMELRRTENQQKYKDNSPMIMPLVLSGALCAILLLYEGVYSIRKSK